MDVSLLWRAPLVQALAVAVVFVLLLALPLPEDFFRDYGAVVGPTTWLACSLLAGRVLLLPLGVLLRSALGSGVAGGAVGVLIGHTAGLLMGIAAFGLLAALYGREDRRAVPSPAGTAR